MVCQPVWYKARIPGVHSSDWFLFSLSGEEKENLYMVLSLCAMPEFLMFSVSSVPDDKTNSMGLSSCVILYYLTLLQMQ
jgi:hypothetical protein